MATGNIRKTGGKRNYAKPTTPPSTASASTVAETTSVNISFTGPTAPFLGPQPLSYRVTGTATDGATVSTTIFTSPTTVSGFSGASSYDIVVSSENYNGVGAALVAATGLVIPTIYSLALNTTSTTTYTVPTGVKKIAAYVIGAGGSGGSGGQGSSNPNNNGGGAGGGGSGAIVGFKDFSVTSGQTVTITIGAGGSGGSGGTSIVAYGGTNIATAVGGSGGNSGSQSAAFSHGARGNGGSGGTGTSNVAGAVLVTGITGGNGASDLSPGFSASAGAVQTSSSNITDNQITAILPSNNVYGSGGGGGVRGNRTGAAGAGGGGTGASGQQNSNVNTGGTSATAVAAGGGGGVGGRGAHFSYNDNVAGFNGFAGQVILYIA